MHRTAEALLKKFYLDQDVENTTESENEKDRVAYNLTNSGFVRGLNALKTQLQRGGVSSCNCRELMPNLPLTGISGASFTKSDGTLHGKLATFDIRFYDFILRCLVIAWIVF